MMTGYLDGPPSLATATLVGRQSPAALQKPSAPPAAPPGHLYAFDALRALAALAVVYGHSTMSFLLPFWAGIQDVSAGRLGRVVLRESSELLHCFVLPVFFVVAGFLARRSCTRHGVWRMLRDRCRRVLVPLVIGVLAIVPVLHLLQQLGKAAATQGASSAWPQIQQYMFGGGLLRHFGPHYLWFLYYLVIFYAITAAGHVAVRAVASRRLQANIDRVMVFLCRSRWTALILAAPALVAVALVQGPIVVEAGHDFFAQPPLLLMYGLFFLFGWLLERVEKRLPSLARNWKWHLFGGLLAWLVGTAMLLSVHSEETDFRIPRFGPDMQTGAPSASEGDSPIFAAGQSPVAGNAVSAAKIGTVPREHEGRPPEGFPVYQFMKAYVSWALTLGSVALALRVVTGPGRVMRHLAGASYWIYLAHVPLLMAVQLAIAQWMFPWWIKIFVMDALVVGLLLVIYHLYCSNRRRTNYVW